MTTFIDPWAALEPPPLRESIQALENKINTIEGAGLEAEIDAIEATLAKSTVGATAASEVETLEVTHGLASAPKVFVANVEQATFVGVGVTELGATKVKIKFGAKTASGAKVLWYAST